MDLYNGWLLLIIDTYNPNIFPTCWEHTIDVGKIPKMLGTYYGCWDIPYMLTIIIIVIISFDYLSFFIYLLFFFKLFIVSHFCLILFIVIYYY